ncbi:MAG: hypothetical protein J6I65_02985, partial [Lachnospiraceae bacterium]|nr:hypothetical protein [Lachnospiraceae bacterium]
MADFQKQLKVLSEDIIYEKIKQIGLHVFYSVIVDKNAEEAVADMGEEVKWNGSEEHFIAENKEELKELFLWKSDVLSKDSEMT